MGGYIEEAMHSAEVNARLEEQERSAPEETVRAPSRISTDSSVLVIRMIGGNCPVQAEGTVEGVEFYFRARGNRWTFGVGDDPVGAPVWLYGEPYGEKPFDAGWMFEHEALTFIAKAAGLYRGSLASSARAEKAEGRRDTTS